MDAALARLDQARAAAVRADGPAKTSATDDLSRETNSGGSARIMAMVNSHEKLRDNVAGALSDLDALIEELEGRDAGSHASAPNDPKERASA